MKEAAAQSLIQLGITRITSDLSNRPTHYLRSLSHFCDEILQSPTPYSRELQSLLVSLKAHVYTITTMNESET